jgi:hypothetical protein
MRGEAVTLRARHVLFEGAPARTDTAMSSTRRLEPSDLEPVEAITVGHESGSVDDLPFWRNVSKHPLVQPSDSGREPRSGAACWRARAIAGMRLRARSDRRLNLPMRIPKRFRRDTPAMPRSSFHLAGELRELGVDSGDVLMVHASLRAIGPVEGGAKGVRGHRADGDPPGQLQGARRLRSGQCATGS